VRDARDGNAADYMRRRESSPCALCGQAELKRERFCGSDIN
jgi:hypothetical protein